MAYDPDSEAHADFVAELQVYVAAVSGPFPDGYPAPPAYDAAHDQRSCYAYAAWYAARLSDPAAYTAGGHLPPVPPPLA